MSNWQSLSYWWNVLRFRTSNNHKVWISAFLKLETLGDPAIAARKETLIQKLESYVWTAPDRFLRQDAVGCLLELDASDAVIRALGTGRTNSAIIEVLKSFNSKNSRFGDSLLDEVLAAASEHTSPEVRSASAFELGNLGSRDAVPRLIKLLRDPENSVRSSAAMALGKLKDPCSVNPLIEALAGDRSVAKYAASALNGLGAVKAVPTLVERVVEGDHDIIFWASDLLSESDDERLLEPLVKQVVKDKAVSVLYVLREVLMRSATRATVQTLRAVAEIPDLFVRRQVHYGLIGRVGGSVRGAYGSEEDWIDCSDIRKQAEDELARRASKQT